MRWRPITTFFQPLVDMKNAQTPGVYQASRHDYRPDLTRFVNEVYGLGATEDQLARVELALAQREQALERLFEQPKPPPAGGSVAPCATDARAERLWSRGSAQAGRRLARRCSSRAWATTSRSISAGSTLSSEAWMRAQRRRPRGPRG